MSLKGDIIRIIKMFFSPGEVFKQIKEKQEGIFWITPLLIMLIAAVVYSSLVLPIEISDQIARTEAHPELEEEQIETRITYLETSFHFFSSVFAEIGRQLIYYLVIAFLLSVLQVYLGGQSVGYGKFFTGVIYVGMIKSLGLIVEGIIQYSQSSLDHGLHLASVFPEIEGFFAHYLQTISLFGFWQVLLFGLLLQVYYGYSKLKSFSIVFSLWLLWNVVLAYISSLQAEIWEDVR